MAVSEAEDGAANFRASDFIIFCRIAHNTEEKC